MAMTALPFTACAPSDEPADVPREVSASPEPAPRPGIRFDPDSVTPGTRVGDLMLDSIRVGRTPSGPSVGSAFFGGEMTLTGHTLHHFDADLAPISVCFEADSASAARMPRWKGDERRPWFCFENPDEAARMVAAPDDSVSTTVVVDDFTIHFSFSDAVNSARLVRAADGDGS